MANEAHHSGQCAAPGIAIGPLVRLTRSEPEGPGICHKGTPEEETARLRAALERARNDLETLAAAHGSDGAAILEFQIEMLNDPALIVDALAAINNGMGASRAWRAELDRQIADFKAADDAYFRARTSDLIDLRDRVVRELALREIEDAALPPDAILFDTDLAPSRFLALDWASLGGIALAEGSLGSHVALLARGRGVPMVTSLGVIGVANGDAILDATAGLLITSPSALTSAAYAARLAAEKGEALHARRALAEPATTADGQPISVMINVDDPSTVDDELLDASDGVGLLRTEFLFIGKATLPDEDEQYAAYRRLLDRLKGKPCIIRTLDIGGDKPLAGLNLPAETNPFLGLRGLRLCLERPDLFHPQIRALLRAAVDRPVKVMLPMVSTAAELARARALFKGQLADLQAAGTAAAMPPIGIMVETPAAALTLDLLDAAFYSIGSNDLIQYVMAASRDASGQVAALADPMQPAVQRIIAGIVATADIHRRPISLCGEMAADRHALPALLAMGLRSFSVAPAALGRVKLWIGECTLSNRGRRHD